MSLRPVSKSVMALSKPVFQRKYLKLGRIYQSWPQIIGEEYAEKALPVALKTRPIKKRGTSEKIDMEITLHLIADSATALRLSYQKERILGRIEHIFGERLVTELKILHNHTLPRERLPGSGVSKTLTQADKEMIGTLIASVQDQSLRERLEFFGCSLYLSASK